MNQPNVDGLRRNEKQKTLTPLPTTRNERHSLTRVKPTIVHVIDNLCRGGAETLLVDLLKDLSQHYNIILVTLNEGSDFDEKEVKCQYRYSLGYTSKFKFVSAVRQLKKIIKRHQPVLVRSQLYWSTIISRVACPKDIPLVFSVHFTFSDAAFEIRRKGGIIKWIEKITYKKRHTFLAVTQMVADDYEKMIGFKGKSYVLHNYTNEAYFDNATNYVFEATRKLKLVAVGNPRKQKNYELLIDAFKQLNDPTVTCDIYGSGPHDSVLQQKIDDAQVPIVLKGKSSVVHTKLKEYDAFVMTSVSEGFGIAVVEAMAVGLPLLLTDLKVLREVTCGNAIFFDPHNQQELAGKIVDFRKGKYDAVAMSEKGKEISRRLYSKETYLQKILDIYKECISSHVAN
jgi:glycosyltransferase involved in cell wall biosynthesis